MVHTFSDPSFLIYLQIVDVINARITTCRSKVITSYTEPPSTEVDDTFVTSFACRKQKIATIVLNSLHTFSFDIMFAFIMKNDYDQYMILCFIAMLSIPSGDVIAQYDLFPAPHKMVASTLQV